MRGQGALEFIGTYGWALLMVLVAMAALAYFGVLSPSSFIPEKCLFEKGIACMDYGYTYYEEDGSGGSMNPVPIPRPHINFILRNNYGRTLQSPTWNFSLVSDTCNSRAFWKHMINILPGDGTNFGFLGLNKTGSTVSNGKNWEPDKDLIIELSCENGIFQSGTYQKISVTITGRLEGSQYPTVTTGTVMVKVP
ncbi:MAG: hypothetical protein V1725_04820 [archaeon]